MPGAQDPWHLDKRVPVALIIAILLQTAGAIWWAANISSRVDHVERRTVSLEDADRRMADTAVRVAETLAAIKTSQDDTRRALDRIERHIDGRRAAP